MTAKFVSTILAAVPLLLALPAGASGVHVNLGSSPLVVAPGDSFTVQVIVTTSDAAFNAFDANIGFDPTRLSFLTTAPLSAQIGPVMASACGNFFHRFVAHPNFLEINLSLLCANTSVTGPGAVYQVRFKASPSDSGNTLITLNPGTQFYNAGFFVNPLDKSDLAVFVGHGTLGVDDGGPIGAGLTMETPFPNPRIGSGSARFSFSLPQADRVGLELFDLQGRSLLRREPEAFAAGRHSIDWKVPELSAGTYFARLTTESGAVAERRWVLLH